MAAISEEPSSMTKPPAAKKTLLDLPAETIASIFDKTTDHDLAQLCRVSKYIRELAAAELYRSLNHIFQEEHVSPDPELDYLAGFLETLATSDYNYAAHVKEVSVDTSYTATKADQLSRQFSYDLTCGKFFNTLLLAALKRTRALERFTWNVRIELSTAVYRELHQMPNLRRVLIRLQAGQSLHAANKSNTGTNQFTASLSTSPVSPGQPPAGTHSPGGGWGFQSTASPKTSIRVVTKLPVNRPEAQPRSFSGFKNLKELYTLELDTFDYIPELAESVQNSLDTLKELGVSLSDALARRARDKPRVDNPETATTEDASSVASQSIHPAEGGAPSGANPDQMRQWHRNRQETVLAKILAPTSTRSVHQEAAEAVTNEIVLRAENEAQQEEQRRDEVTTSNQLDDDQLFVKTIRSIFHDVKLKQDSYSQVAETMDKVERAATKYLEGRSKGAVDDPKVKSGSKSSGAKLKPPKPPGSQALPMGQGSSPDCETYSVHEDLIVEYFNFSPTEWEQLNSLIKQQYVQSYFDEDIHGLGTQYPIVPLPSSSTTTTTPTTVKPVMKGGKYYYVSSAIPSSGGGGGGLSTSSKYIPTSKKSKKTLEVKSKHATDSEDQAKLSKSDQGISGEGGGTAGFGAGTSPPDLGDPDAIGNDPEMLYPSDGDEDEGPDQEFVSEDEAVGNEENHEVQGGGKEASDGRTEGDAAEPTRDKDGTSTELGVSESGPKAVSTSGKGKQAVRDPPNGHLTPPAQATESSTQNQADKENSHAPPADAVDAKSAADGPVSKYLRLAHGLPLESLAFYLVPVKPTTLLHHFDMYALRHLALLNVGSQRRIWATLTKLQHQSPLPLNSVYTDNVTPSLLTFLASLEAGQLENLFLLEHYVRRKGRMPQLPDCDQTVVIARDIRKQVLQRHMKGIRRLMIRNDDADTWAMTTNDILLVAREGGHLEELAIQCDSENFHTLVRSLWRLPKLFALQITFIIDTGTPPLSMTGPAAPANSQPPHHHHHHHHHAPAYGVVGGGGGGGGAGAGDGVGSIEPHTAASALLLHELRQSVVDGVSLCSATSPSSSPQLQYLGFSWHSTTSGDGSYLDGDGNPYVFLSRITGEVDTGSQWYSGDESGAEENDDGKKEQDGLETEVATAAAAAAATIAGSSKSPEGTEGSSRASVNVAQKAESGEPIRDDAAATSTTTNTTTTTGSATAAAGAAGSTTEEGHQSQEEEISRGAGAETGAGVQDGGGGGTGEKSHTMVYWSQDDLNISEVSGIRIWEKEFWAGRL